MARVLLPSDKQESLASAKREVLTELEQVRREEEYLLLKVRQAREQARYYEGLLTLLRRDFGNAQGLPELLRRIG